MIIYNDQFVAKEELRLSPEDRGYYFGDGIYEVFRIYGGKIFEKEAHFERLQRSSVETRIMLPYVVEEIEMKLEQLLHLEKVIEGTIYLQITRGAAPRAHPFPKGVSPILYAYCNEVTRPIKLMQDGITALTLPDIRWLRCDLKTLNLLPNVLAKQEVMDRGADECIFHRDGMVTECTASNLMMIKDGVLHTHPANHLILQGVTRGVILRLAASLDIPAVEEPFHVDTLIQADEAFITGTIMEIVPIINIDGQPVGNGQPGSLTRKLQSSYEQLIMKIR